MNSIRSTVYTVIRKKLNPRATPMVRVSILRASGEALVLEADESAGVDALKRQIELATGVPSTAVELAWKRPGVAATRQARSLGRLTFATKYIVATATVAADGTTIVGTADNAAGGGARFETSDQWMAEVDGVAKHAADDHVDSNSNPDDDEERAPHDAPPPGTGHVRR